MNKFKILIINNNHNLTVPTENEIQSIIPGAQITETDSIYGSMSKIHTGDYKVLVICGKIDGPDAMRLAQGISIMAIKPSVIIIGESHIDGPDFDDEISDLCIVIKKDHNLKENLILALDAASKRIKLVNQIAILNEQLRQANINQNIVDLTLSYNSEINNILTAMIGNIQLMLRTTKDLSPDAMDKLTKIDQNAQRILKMASCLIDIINAPSETLPLGEYDNQ